MHKNTLNRLMASKSLIHHHHNMIKTILSSSMNTIKTTNTLRNYAITKIPLPSLSPTMTSGEIVNWVKKEGDKVNVGDILCEIRTDKSVLEFESVEEGILGKIVLPGGSKNIPMGATIAYLVDKKEEISSIPSESDSQTPSAATTPTTKPSTSASQASRQEQQQQPHESSFSHSAPLSPAVLRILHENSWINTSQIKPSGRGGRLTKSDLVQFMATNPQTVGTPSTPQTATTTTQQASVVPPTAVKASQVASPSTTMVTQTPLTSSFNDIPTTQIRKIIASRLLESKQTVPHSYFTIEARIDKLLNIKNRLANEKNIKASVNDLIIYCASKALQRVPECNVVVKGNQYIQAENIDISFAVATPTGLITPIIPKTNTKTIEQIASSVKELSKRAKENKLKPEEFQGGTFCISNLGMFGIQHFSAVINPPHGIILAIGSSQKKPVLPSVDLDADTPIDTNINDVEMGTFMSVTASCDARAVDRELAGRFMQVLREELEFSFSL
ncbi:hypothetical protein C9374_011312 [Naegleria lovaniensis]|uniref:Dihydrolipoamide acetyltransferase component of pyruvate dehydrogenase complex n=1 Tax=Naegleria lovaniensis TaxID=51637 RepID=A0AA88KQR5_NAELO|nr:uncharacterized protein C9374_011312 [Naegleria lovaniensis]KAG2392587.1 hypothetical protein C9374_011312 [Naegleria lovaniensis]